MLINAIMYVFSFVVAQFEDFKDCVVFPYIFKGLFLLRDSLKNPTSSSLFSYGRLIINSATVQSGFNYFYKVINIKLC